MSKPRLFSAKTSSETFSFNSRNYPDVRREPASRLAWSRRSILLLMLWAAGFSGIFAARASTNQWVRPYAVDSLGNVISNVTPGQVFQIYSGTRQSLTIGGDPNALPVSDTITFQSVTGGTVNLAQNVFYTEVLPGHPFQAIQITSLPFDEPYFGIGVSFPRSIWVQAGQLPKQGKAPPVVMKINFSITNTTGDYSVVPPVVKESGTITLPVNGNPALYVNLTTTTTETTGVLHPGQTATYAFETDAHGLDMQNITFKASIPAGTKVMPGSISPGTGVVNGNAILWMSTGDLTSFNCGFSVEVSTHPGTKSAVVNYNAASRVLGRAVSKSGSKKVPIQNFGEGRIDYLAPGGAVDADVAVDDQCTYRLHDWDWLGPGVIVKLNGQYIGVGSENDQTGPFTVPVFKSANLESVLSAEQTGNPIDTIVTGAEAAQSELVAGSVDMVDSNGDVARKLALRGKVAKGEVVLSDTASPNQLGHLQLGSANSAVVLLYPSVPGAGSDVRLVFAEQGHVFVYGSVRATQINVVKGALVNYTKQNLTGFNTMNSPNVVGIGGTYLNTPQTLTGFNYAASDVSIGGNITLSSPIAYFAGNVTIKSGATVSGLGSIIVIGNLTVESGATLKLQNSTGLTLGVGGKFIIE